MELSSLEARILRFILSQSGEKCKLSRLRAGLLSMSVHLLDFHLNGLALKGLLDTDGKRIWLTSDGMKLRGQIPEYVPPLRTLTVRV